MMNGLGMILALPGFPHISNKEKYHSQISFYGYIHLRVQQTDYASAIYCTSVQGGAINRGLLVAGPLLPLLGI
jgi:hypothetical protein